MALNTKPCILVFIDWFWPGYLAGGPIQSVLSIVQYLKDDIDFKIVTTNTDLNSTKAYENIEPNKWIKSPIGCEVLYLERSQLSVETINAVLIETAFDKIYINSFFSEFFSIIPLRILKKHFPQKPVIVAPRGMLGKGALSIKPLKKQLFFFYARVTGLHKNVFWHATSLQEKSEIERSIKTVRRIFLVSNLPKKINAAASRKKTKEQLNVCFISRISPKKNLVFALEALALVKNVRITFDIYGPKEDPAYWSKCETLIKQLPSNVTAKYRGSLSPDELEMVYGKSHLLFLPSLNENFGHSIVESLMCACPVLISDQTPWSDVADFDAGFALSLDKKQAFAEQITALAKLDEEHYNKKCEASINYISSKIKIPEIVNAYKLLFNA